jgi:hypothetical protein
VLAQLLVAVLDQGQDVVIRRGCLPAHELGCVEFDSRTITISRTATAAQARTTLGHELRHLLRGPFPEDEEMIEEMLVEEETARAMVPREALPPILEAADPYVVAEELGIDVATARLGISLAMRDRVQGEGAQEVA